MPYFPLLIPEEKSLEEEGVRLLEEGKRWRIEPDGSFTMSWNEGAKKRSIYFSADRSARSVEDGFGTHSEQDARDAEIAYNIALKQMGQERAEEREAKVPGSYDAMVARMEQEKELARASRSAQPRGRTSVRGSARVDGRSGQDFWRD